MKKREQLSLLGNQGLVNMLAKIKVLKKKAYCLLDTVSSCLSEGGMGRRKIIVSVDRSQENVATTRASYVVFM